LFSYYSYFTVIVIHGCKLLSFSSLQTVNSIYCPFSERHGWTETQ